MDRGVIGEWPYIENIFYIILDLFITMVDTLLEIVMSDGYIIAKNLLVNVDKPTNPIEQKHGYYFRNTRMCHRKWQKYGLITNL